MSRWLLVTVGLLALFVVAPPAEAEEAVAALNSFEATPSIIGIGRGSFHAEIAPDLSEITYTLKYERMSSSVTQAHIHIGQAGVAGGVSVFLCTNLGNGPPSAPACPPSPGEVSGSLVAADVIPGAAGQGVGAGDIGQLVRAMRQGSAYVNVHTEVYPAGEIRNQIEVAGRR